MMDRSDSTDAASRAGSPGSSRSTLFIVFLVVFIDLLGFGIVLPLLPLYATEILEPLWPGADNEPMRGMILGLLMSSFSAMQFIFAPMWGRISDRIGRRWILLLGLAGSVVFYTLFGVASEVAAAGSLGLGLALLFAARVGAGIAGATISTAQAVIADTTSPDKRAHGMALIGAAFGIGFTFGPLIGFASLLFPASGAPGFVAAGFSLLALVLGLKLLSETFRPGSESVGRRQLFDWTGLREVLAMPAIGLLVLTFFLSSFAFAGLESTLALVNRVLLQPDLDPAIHLTAQEMRDIHGKNFLIFAYIGLIHTLNLGLIYRRLVRRVGEIAFMRTGMVLMAAGLAGAAAILLSRDAMATPSAAIVWGMLAMTVAVMGFAYVTPSVQSLISRRADPDRQGEVLGVNQSGSALARILGPVTWVPLFHVSPGHELPYQLGIGVMVLVFLLTLRIRDGASPV